MADRGDTHYHVPGLNTWFLLSSAFLLVTAVWMVIDDYQADWKNHQRAFRAIELERAQAELESGEAKAVEADEAAAEAELERAEAALAKRSAELAELQDELFEANGKVFTTVETAKAAKQEYNWERYVIEEERLHKGDPTYGAETLAAVEQAMLDTAGEQELAELALKQVEDRLASLRSDVTAAETKLKLAGKTIELVRKKKESIAPEALPEKIANLVRDDIPGLDFIGPTIKVQKVVLPDLTFELNFTKKVRIDMCMTCHMAADREGYDGEELEEPYRSHPRLDLYLTAKSPHPYTKVGCTICHRGAGEALDFGRVDHNIPAFFAPAADPMKVERWRDEFHWHKKHYWDYPQLTSDKLEASCVQCHTTSMELIADDAPEVTEGYRLFERYGCYSCHKVEWFPTTRRPGPTLKNIQAKTNPEFLASWISDPRGFRPTTWMPQIFHLENFDEEQVIAKSKYGEGREILGKEWNDSAVAAITAFLLDRAPEQVLDPIPVEGNAQRGREAFRLSGCLACHNTAPFEGAEPVTADLAFDPNRYNEHGPNLRGVATKVKPEWLYWWIKDPAAMWSETRMPNLRLSDQDAADVTAFILEDPDGVFSEVPAGWETADSPYDVEALQEQARWYFSRVSRAALEKRFEGGDPAYAWDRPEELLVAVGEKLVGQYGCFSCHEIAGMETGNPIGTELTTWGSKTVDKLDWALLANIKQEEEGWDQHARTEYKSYRENWIRQKLHEPRSFDREKEKSPTERLKMPWFDFEADEVEALITFVVGLVDDEVQRAKMIPTAEQLSMDQGLRSMRQQNCAACHLIDPGTVTYRDEGGVERTVTAELLSMDAFTDVYMPALPPQTDLASMNAYLDQYADATEEEVEEVGFRLLAVEPDAGMPGDNVFVPREDILDVTPAWGGDFVQLVTNYYYYGIEQFDPDAGEDEQYYYLWGSDDPDAYGLVEDADGESRDYTTEQYDKLRWTFAPPVLWGEGAKLQKPWFYAFLNDPMPLRPQLRVRMPSFNFPAGHAGSIADYFASKAALAWPADLARRMRIAEGVDVAQMASAIGISADTLRGIENGSRPDTEARFAEVLAYAAKTGFRFMPAVNTEHERLVRRSPSYLDHVSEAHADYLSLGNTLAREGPQCFQCHFDDGVAPNADPIAWGPDLVRVRERLREDWVYRWMENPSRIYPGTAMPGNFLSDPPQYQAVYPDSSNPQQINAVVDWLFNYDRVPPHN